MKKSFILLGFFLCFGGGILLGYFFGTHKGDSEKISVIQNINPSSSGNKFSSSQILSQALLFGNIPLSKKDCEKSTESERENCLVSLAVRGARDTSDITRCKGLKDQTRCEKIISDEFSNQFPMPPR